MNLKQNKTSKSKIDLITDQKTKVQYNFRDYFCKSKKHYLPEKLAEDVRRINWLVTARTARECIKTQPKVISDKYKQNKTQVILLLLNH